MRFGVRVATVLLVFLTSADAADYVVVTNADSGPGSLRQAILDADAGGGGNIVFSNVSSPIVVQSGLPVLTNLIISGPGSSELTVSNANLNIFSILTNSAASTGAISHLTINATLDNYGTMTLDNIFVGNQRNPGVPGLYNAGSMILSRCTFANNQAEANWDAIVNDGMMTLDHCTISSNRGDGDIFNHGNLTMDNCVVSGHTWFTSSDGGIINDGGVVVLRNCSISSNSSVEGGGIWNAGSLAVTNCTINGNSAQYSGPGERGGGVFNIGYAILQNTTISGNLAFGDGGGIWNGGGLRLLNCTIASNTATAGGRGGIWNETSVSAVFQSRNSIIAGNSYEDIHGYFETFGHNNVLSTNDWSRTGDNTTDLIGVDPLLGPLQNNGGPTWTHALTQGSSAIDAADPIGAPTEDQRGVPRPQGPGFDIGSFEFVSATNPVFANIEVQSQTNIILTGIGSPFTSYALQLSRDFVSWTNVANVTSPLDGTLQFTEPIAYSNGFFRLRSQTP